MNEREDFELGEDVTELAASATHPVGIVLSVRLSAEEADAVLRAAEMRGMGPVEYLRRLALSDAHLLDTQMKAAGSATLASIPVTRWAV